MKFAVHGHTYLFLKIGLKKVLAQPFACVDNECRVICEIKDNKFPFVNNAFRP
jgi:hypothetical protein